MLDGADSVVFQQRYMGRNTHWRQDGVYSNPDVTQAGRSGLGGIHPAGSSAVGQVFSAGPACLSTAPAWRRARQGVTCQTDGTWTLTGLQLLSAEVGWAGPVVTLFVPFSCRAVASTASYIVSWQHGQVHAAGADAAPADGKPLDALAAAEISWADIWAYAVENIQVHTTCIIQSSAGCTKQGRSDNMPTSHSHSSMQGLIRWLTEIAGCSCASSFIAGHCLMQAATVSRIGLDDSHHSVVSAAAGAIASLLNANDAAALAAQETADAHPFTGAASATDSAMLLFCRGSCSIV